MQLAESMRVELRHQDRRRCAIAGAHARRDRGIERRPVQSLGAASSARSASVAAPHQQRLRLRERVGDEQRLLVAERMRGAHGNDEFDRRLARALVQPLEERVLAVGAGVRPTAPASSGRRARRRRARRACRCFRARAAAGRRAAAPAPARTGRRRARACRSCAAFHQPTSPSSTGQVALERRRAEVRVDARGAGEKLGEAFPAELERDRQARRRPQRIAAADPVPAAAARRASRRRTRARPARCR